MKTYSHIKNQSNIDFMYYLKNAWKQLPFPKPFLSNFMEEYFIAEKELFDFLNATNFILESVNNKNYPANNYSDKEPKRGNSFFLIN